MHEAGEELWGNSIKNVRNYVGATQSLMKHYTSKTTSTGECTCIFFPFLVPPRAGRADYCAQVSPHPLTGRQDVQEHLSGSQGLH